MSTIWMDPTELKSTTGFLTEQALRVQETVIGTRTSCLCDVPRSLIGWLDAELLGITEDAMKVVVGYLSEALDCKVRSEEIQADQSLVTSTAGSVVAGANFGSWLTPMTAEVGTASSSSGVDPTGWLGEMTIGGDRGPAFTTSDGTDPSTWLGQMTIGGDRGPAFTSSLGQASSTIVGGTPNYAAGPLGSLMDPATFARPGSIGNLSMSDILSANSDAISTTLAPMGLTYDHGAYVDDGGDRSSSLAGQYRDPHTGKYDIS